jgi:hypothetical protein
MSRDGAHVRAKPIDCPCYRSSLGQGYSPSRPTIAAEESQTLPPRLDRFRVQVAPAIARWLPSTTRRRQVVLPAKQKALRGDSALRVGLFPCIRT